MFRGGFLGLFADRRTTLRGAEGISSSLQRRAHSRASQPLNTADRPTSHNGPIMRARCTWVFASARSFNRNPSVRRASLSLRSQAPPFAGSRTPTAPGLEGRFPLVTPKPDHRAGSFLCVLTQGADPQLKESANWSLQADSTLSVLRNFIEKRRASHCEIRLKLSASSPVPSPSSQAPHPHPPKAVMLCAGSCPRCTKLASPLVSQVKWGVGFTPAGAAFFKKAQKSRIFGNRVQVPFPDNSLSSAASRTRRPSFFPPTDSSLKPHAIPSVAFFGKLPYGLPCRGRGLRLRRFPTLGKYRSVFPVFGKRCPFFTSPTDRPARKLPTLGKTRPENFQPSEKSVPNFPRSGNISSKVWKTDARFFQPLEN